MKRCFLLALSILWLVGSAGLAKADLITYTFVGTGSGTAGGTPFSDAGFTIQVTADTNDVILSTQFPGFVVFVAPALSSTVSIVGIGSGQFTTGKAVFDNQTTSGLGFSEATGTTLQMDLLDIRNPGFATYDLRTPFGPVFDPNPFPVEQFRNIPTSFGSLSFTSYRDVTFQASVVPEPSTLTLFGIGILGLIGWSRQRWKQPA